jgi:hypothetical protein
MSTGDFWIAVFAIATIICIMVIVANLVFVSRQIADSHRFMQAQLINELEKEFNEFTGVFEQLRHPESLQLLGSNQAVQGKFIECLSFFERIKRLLDTKIIDIQLGDRVFGYSFFLLVNTPEVQDEILYIGDYRFAEIFALHKELSDFRRSQNHFIPLPETNLPRRNLPLYKANLKHYSQMIKV